MIIVQLCYPILPCMRVNVNSIIPVTFSRLQSISYGGGGAKTLVTPVDRPSLPTAFDLEAYRRRRIAAVPKTTWGPIIVHKSHHKIGWITFIPVRKLLNGFYARFRHALQLLRLFSPLCIALGPYYILRRILHLAWGL